MAASDHLGSQFDDYDDYVQEMRADRDEAHLPQHDEAAWSPAHLFHGTNADLRPGDMVSPEHMGTHTPWLNGGSVRQKYAFSSSRLSHAADYAERAAYGKGGRPRVYEVEHADDMTPDPEEGRAFGMDYSGSPNDWRSPTGFRVKARVSNSAVKKVRGGQWDNDYRPGRDA